MEEATIRGLVQGGMFFALLIVVWGIRKIMTSPSEGAKRMRWVIYAGIAFLVFAILMNIGGYAAVITILISAGLCYWIYQGFKRKP